MPAAARLSDFCTGHGCFPPRPNDSASDTVTINSRGAHRLGDSWDSHCCGDEGCHRGVTVSGSSTVTINGRPAGRVGDVVSCGSQIGDGSPTVTIGG